MRPWLGATGQGVSQDIATSLGMKRPTGVLINSVYKGGAANKAGLRVGDVVLAVNGHEVNDPKGLRYRIATLPVGETAALRVMRKDRTMALKLLLAPPPETPSPNFTVLTGQQPLAGSKVANLSPALADEFGLDPFVSGVVVIEMTKGSPANRLGFRLGDLVRSVNGKDVANVAHLRSLMSVKSSRWHITVDRGGKVLSLTING